MIKQRRATVKTATATVTVEEMGDILCNSPNAQTYTLPAASLGLWYRFSNINTGKVTISNGATIATLAQNEQRLILNNGAIWYAFRDRASIPFIGLSDVPTNYTSSGSKFVKVKADATGLEFVEGEAIASAFTDLTDVPSSYVGNAAKIVAVNLTEDSLEFIDAPTGGGLVINPNHIFVDNTARDDYFTANPAEQIAGIYISVGAGFQQWDGAIWLDKTAVVAGPTGADGVAGLPGTTIWGGM